MITGEILKFVNQKLVSVRNYLIIIGFLFFVLAITILFYPEVLQIVFIFSFLVISFSAFLIAVKVNNIKEHFDRVVSIFPKKNKKQGRKKGK